MQHSARSQHSVNVDAASFWKDFRHGTTAVDGVRLHYVEGGSGAPILLIPGWPQSWYAWRLVMPLLAASGRRVISVDPRGIGDSDWPSSNYDMRTVAAEIRICSRVLRSRRDARSPVLLSGCAQPGRPRPEQKPRRTQAGHAPPGLRSGTRRGTRTIDTLRPIANDVQGGVMMGCGHYMPEEHPETVGTELLRFFEATDR
jgi:pimeloyl-ACP methyl ester carboxylesterase